MALFEDVFNRTTLYDMLFFNIKAVLEHPTLEDLEANNVPLFECWKHISRTKYNTEVRGGEHIDDDVFLPESQMVYLNHAPYYPEFTKIVAITYASVYAENGVVKREFKKIASLDETVIIKTMMDVFYQLSSDAMQSKPVFFRPLCGHNIIAYDIPLLIKRHLRYNEEIISKEEKPTREELPLILKRCLNVKPWESGLIDVVNVWKFNGFDNMPIMLIADFLGLKKNVDILPLNELSQYYWDNIEKNQKETLDFISLQSATQTNLVIQLMNALRQY